MWRRVGFVVAWMLAASGPATGARRVGVIVRAASPAPVDAPTVAAEVARIIQGSGDLPVVDPVGVAARRRQEGAVARGRLDVLRRARELTEEGWRAYLAGDATFAEAQLSSARQKLEEALDLEGTVELVADVSLRLGAVRSFAGRADEARTSFFLALLLDPGREVGRQEFKPDVVAATEGLRLAPPDPSAQLEVRSEAGAQIEIDGSSPAPAPLRRAVSPGEHLVVARAPGRHARGQLVLVAREGTVLEVPLEPDRAAKRLAEGEHAFRIGLDAVSARELLDGIVSLGELDEVLLVGVTWRLGRPALLAQRCGLALLCTRVVELGFPKSRVPPAVEALLARLPSKPGQQTVEPILFEDTRMTEPDRAPREAPTSGPRRTPRPWWRSSWLWGGAGTVAVLGIAAAILITEDSPPEVVIDVGACAFGPPSCAPVR